MSHTVRTQLSFCSFLIVALLLMLLGLRLDAVPAIPPQEVTNSIGMKLVLIPAGKFMMGSPKDEKDREQDEDQHEVEITKDFYLGVYTVTQAEYEKVMGNNPSRFSAKGDGKDKVKDMDTSRFPVENVSWDDAVVFCKKLSELAEENEGEAGLSSADRSRVGICLPGQDQNGLPLWRFAVVQAGQL